VVTSVIDDHYPILVGAAPTALPDFEAGWELQREQAPRELEQLASKLDLRSEVNSVVGDPGHELRRLSESVDLVAVGSRRWGPIAGLVTGGVGETLVADAGCAVLIVPRPPEDE
jgi:nucleotide-binding universal stress UspA family protein